MKKGLLITSIVLAFAGSAFAQESAASQGITVRAGFAYPTDKDTRDTFRDYWFGVGLDYQIKSQSYNFGQKVYSLGLSADWYQATRRVSGIKLEGTALPVYLTLSSQADGGVYYGAGLGAAFNKARFSTGSGSASESTTKLAYTAFVGYQLPNQNITLDLRYHGNGAKELNALGFYVGFKF
jgi:opacity protein-like surface antigen